MNRLRLYIAAFLLICGTAFSTVTKVDSIENFVSSAYKGGTIFKIGVASDLYGIIWSSSTENQLLTIATFTCSDAGVLPAAVIDTRVIITGNGTLGENPAAIWMPGTENFIGSVSHDATGSNDSTWVFTFSVDTSDGTIGAGAITKIAIKYAPTRDHKLIRIGTSNYYALAYRRVDAYTCGIKTFLAAPATPAISDVTIDSLSTSGYSIDIDELGSSDYYVVTNWYGTYNAVTRSISQADGTIGAQVTSSTIYNASQQQGSNFVTYAVNDSIFVGGTSANSGNYDRNMCSFKASPYDASITIGPDSVVDCLTKCDEIVVAANDSGAIAFYFGYWTAYDGYLIAYDIDQADGAFGYRQQGDRIFTQDLDAAAHPIALMLTDDSRYVLLAYRGADTYGWLRTLQLTPVYGWAHNRSGVPYPTIDTVDGVGLLNIDNVDGVEK